METILLYRLGWDPCILAVIGRWLLCSGGYLLRFHCTSPIGLAWTLGTIAGSRGRPGRLTSQLVPLPRYGLPPHFDWPEQMGGCGRGSAI